MSLGESGPFGGETGQLSRRRRRDLLELTAAGIMSVIFVAAPVFLVRNTPRDTAIAPQVREMAQASAGARVQIVTTDVAAQVSTPALQSSRAVYPALRRAALPPRPRGALASARARVPLGRRLARLFAGDGTHTVQPFPTVPSAER